jgi:hypothetical protein
MKLHLDYALCIMKTMERQSEEIKAVGHLYQGSGLHGSLGVIDSLTIFMVTFLIT